MKKKPELLKRTGKSSLTLKNFLNNLKENDLHYENKQITQCVFLGVLRLKPVPSIFSKNNVPSVSAPVETNKAKRIRNNNSNRELNKNVSKKSDINKVLGGKVSKKNPEKVKAAVKKISPKKPTFKIKLNTKKKINKVKKIISSNDKHETLSVSPDNLQTVACDSIPSSPTITLNSIVSPSKFNPVQNLFDKLKQKIDEGYSEPGPSTVTKHANKMMERSFEGPSKVCKINAKRPVNSCITANKKAKKAINKKPVIYERRTMPLKPTSPITISDVESTGKKDDIIIIYENNLSCTQGIDQLGAERLVTEDIIFINEDSKLIKHKERTSPRSKIVSLTQEKERSAENDIIIINDEQRSANVIHQFPLKPNENSQGLTGENSKEHEEIYNSEIILISDESKTKEIRKSSPNKTAKENDLEKDDNHKSQELSQNFKSDVIVIDEMLELERSLCIKETKIRQEKSKKVEYSKSIQEQATSFDEVIILNEKGNRIPEDLYESMETSSAKASRSELNAQHNIIIDNQQNGKNIKKTSPRLLKVFDNDSVEIKKELMEANSDTEVIIVTEKPKARKNKLKSASIPPMFLNAPMLLRSELAPKKTTSIFPCEKPKITKRKEKSMLKLSRSNTEPTKNLKNSPVKLSETDSPQIVSTSENEIIFITDHAKTKRKKQSNRSSKSTSPGKSLETMEDNHMQKIDLVTEVEKQSKITNRKEKSMPKLSRSDKEQTRNFKNSSDKLSESNSPQIMSTSENEEIIFVADNANKTGKKLLNRFSKSTSPEKCCETIEENHMKKIDLVTEVEKQNKTTKQKEKSILKLSRFESTKKNSSVMLSESYSQIMSTSENEEIIFVTDHAKKTVEKPSNRYSKSTSPEKSFKIIEGNHVQKIDLVEIEKQRKITEQKEKSMSKLSRSDAEQSRNHKNSLVDINESNSPQIMSTSENEEIIFVTDHVKKTVEKPSDTTSKSISPEKTTGTIEENVQKVDLVTEVEKQSKITKKEKSTSKLSSFHTEETRNLKNSSITLCENNSSQIMSTFENKEIIYITDHAKKTTEKPSTRTSKSISPEKTPQTIDENVQKMNLVTEVEKQNKITKQKGKSMSKLSKSDTKQTRNLKNSSIKLCESNSSQMMSTSEYEEIICITDDAMKTAEKSSSRTSKSTSREKSPEAIIEENHMQKIDLITEVEKLSSDTFKKTTQEYAHSTLMEFNHNSMKDDIIIVNEDQSEELIGTEKKSTSSRVLRSERAQIISAKSLPEETKESEKKCTKPRHNRINNIQKSGSRKQKDKDEVTIKEEFRLGKNSSPRLLRSDLTRYKSQENFQIDDNEQRQSLIKNEDTLIQQTSSRPQDLKFDMPQQTSTDVIPQKKDSDNCTNEVEMLEPQENLSDRQLSSEPQSVLHQSIEKYVAKLDEDVSIIKEEPKLTETMSQRILRSDVAQSIKIEKFSDIEELVQEDENSSPRLLRSENAQQIMKSKPSHKNKQINLDEIVVVNERRMKKIKEKTTSGRLLRSELALQKAKEISSIKTEVEEVVVLIHDEPKPKQKKSPKTDCSQKNKKINIQEEVIFHAEETQLNNNSSPRSLRSDTNKNHSPEETPTKRKSSLPDHRILEKAKVGKPISSSRLLRSEIVIAHNTHNMTKEEAKSAARTKVEKHRILRSENNSKKCPQLMSKSQFEGCDIAEEQIKEHTSSSRLLRSQHSPENLVVDSYAIPEEQQKNISPSRLLRSLTASQDTTQSLQKKSKRPIETKFEKRKLLKPKIICEKDIPVMSTDQPGNCYIADEEQTKKQTCSSRLLRSVTSQLSPQNLSNESESPTTINIPNEQSEMTTSKSSDNMAIESCLYNMFEDKTIKKQPCSSGSLILEIVSTNPEIVPKEQSVDSKIETPTSARMRKSDNAIQKSHSNLLEEPVEENGVMNDRHIERQIFSSRLLRSETSSQKSPQNVAKQGPDSFEEKVEKSSGSNISKKSSQEQPTNKSEGEYNRSKIVSSKRKIKYLPRKTRSLLLDLKTKLKTPMLLRSELAQLKTLDADTSIANKVQEPKKIRSKKGRSKSSPPSSDRKVPIQELFPADQISKDKAPKRKSLIDDLNRKRSPKQKTNIIQNTQTGSALTSEPVTISKEVPKKQNQNNEIKNVMEVTNLKTDANIPHSSAVTMNIEENTIDIPKASDTPQVVLTKVEPSVNIEENALKNSKENASTCEALDDLKSVKLKTKVVKSPSENPLKPRSKSQVSPKNVKLKVSKKISTTKKLKNTVSSPEEVDPAVSEKSSPRQNRKRSAEKSLSNENISEVQKIYKTPDMPKQIDTTVYDFDETEPEVVPLRLTSSRKDKSISPTARNNSTSKLSKSNTDVAPKPKKQKLMESKTNMESKTKAQAKAKLLAMLGDKSSRKNNLDSPEKPKGKSTKTKSASKAETEKDQDLGATFLSPKDAENTKKDKKNPESEKSDTSPTKTTPSPMKQTTITDMFNKVFVKKEKTNLVESIFGPESKEPQPKEHTNENTITDMAPPRVEKKVIPQAKNLEEEENGFFDDDDSDGESRVEWIPEEYAEYKFKYSAKKMMSYKPIHKCKICLLILPSYYRLSQHKKEHTKKPNPYNCTQCDEAFPSIEDLTAHLRIHKGKHPYTCKKCDIGFWSKKALDAHTPIHVLRKVKQPNKRFRCDVCAKEFSKLCDMERHTRVHTGEKPCVCNICNKRFQQSHNLSKHLLTHLHVKPYHCEICNKQFGRNDVLNRHLLTHSVDKPIKCPLCPKGFIRQTQLNNHMKKNHPDAAKINISTESEVVAAN